MQRLFWDKINDKDPDSQNYSVSEDNIIYLRGKNIYKYNLKTQIEEELVTVPETFIIVTIKTEPNFKIFLIQNTINYKLYLLKDGNLEFLMDKVISFSFDLLYKQVLYETKEETNILNLETKEKLTFSQLESSKDFKDFYRKAELIFPVDYVTFMLYNKKLYKFLAIIKILSISEKILVYEKDDKNVLEYHRAGASPVVSNFNLNYRTDNFYQNITFYENNFYLFQRDLLNLSGNIPKVILEKPQKAKFYTHLVRNYLIVDPEMTIYQFNTYFQNPFSPKILTTLSQITNFRIKISKETLSTNKSLIHAYSNIIRTHPEFNCIRFDYDPGFTAATIADFFSENFAGKEISNKEIARLLELTSKSNEKQKTYKQKTFDFSYELGNFLGENFIYYNKESSFMEINLHDNSQKVLLELDEIGTDYIFNENYIFNESFLFLYKKVSEGSKFILYDLVSKEEIWNYPLPNYLETVKLQFDSSGTFICFNSGSYYVLNLTTLKLSEINEPLKSKMITFDFSKIVTTTLTGLIENICGSDCLVFCFDSNIVINNKVRVVIGTISLKIRRSFNDSIVHLGEGKLSFFAYYRNNILVAKTAILTGIYFEKTNEFAFTGKKFIFVKSGEVRSVKHDKITVIFSLQSGFDEISFRGNFFTNNENNIYQLAIFRRNPFSSEEISYLMANFHDISIVAADTTFTFNKTILYAYSETFRSMLSSFFSESPGTSESLTTIREFPVACTQEEFLGAFTAILSDSTSYLLTQKYLGLL